MRKIKHENIIQLEGLEETDQYYYIILEYASQGNLFEYITQKEKVRIIYLKC